VVATTPVEVYAVARKTFEEHRAVIGPFIEQFRQVYGAQPPGGATVAHAT
jgi:hypothetical protein